MTPREFQAIEQREQAKIELAQWRINEARKYADMCPPPRKRRPATARDIVEGAIIWHADGDDGWFWRIVGEVLRPSDDFKAYCADDGCRYGLHRAFVDDDEAQP